MGTKEQPGQFDCYAALEADEPFFVLKATDPSAPLAVIVWSEHYRERKQRAGAWNERAVARYCEAHQIANQMSEWRARRDQSRDEPVPFSVASPQTLLDMNTGRPPVLTEGGPGLTVKLSMASLYGRIGQRTAQRSYFGAGSVAAGMLERMANQGAQSEPPVVDDDFGTLGPFVDLPPNVPADAVPLEPWSETFEPAKR